MSSAGNMSRIPPDAFRMCVLSGADLKIRERQLLTLRECEKLLEQAQAEARAASSSHYWARWGELISRTVLVLCDATVMVLEELTGPAGMIVDKGYGGAKLAVDALSGNVNMQTGAELLLSNKLTIAEMTAKGLGKAKAAASISIGGSIVQMGIQIWNQVNAISEGAGGGAGIEAALRTVTGQIERIRRKIGDLEAEIAACASETGPRVV